MKKISKLLVLLMVLTCLIPTIAACNSNSMEDTTYRSYLSTLPTTLNPHEYTSSDESSIISYMISMPATILLDNPGQDDPKWHWAASMAVDVPEDVTAQYAGDLFEGRARTDSDPDYKIPAGVTKGYARLVTLRDDICWDNGDPIVAQDFVNSLRLLVDPKIQNFRTTAFGTTSASSIRGLAEVIAKLKTDPTVLGKEEEWKNVGFKAVGERKLLFVTRGSNSEFDVLNNMPTRISLVHKETYEQYLTETSSGSGIFKTKYNSEEGACRSYGPFKVESWQPDAELVLVKNDKWFGWDVEELGTYKFNRISYKKISDNDAAVTAFNAGELDAVGLNAVNYPKFSDSSNLLSAPTNNTFSLYFNSSSTALAAIEGAQGSVTNLKYLTNRDFRRGISLSINREALTAAATAGSLPEVSAVNYMWEHDFNNNPGAKYRYTAEGMSVIARLYGYDTTGKSEAEIKAALSSGELYSGFNLTKAKEAFNAAAAAMDGNATVNPIKFRLHTSVLSDTAKILHATIQDLIDEGTKGTRLEGKVEIISTENSKYSDEMENGVIEAIIGGYGRGFMYLAYQITGMFEYTTYGFGWAYGAGFDKINVTINLQGVDYTMTAYEWGLAVQNPIALGGFSDAPMDIKLKIYAELEYTCLNTFTHLPLYSSVSYQLRSFKIEYDLSEYDAIMGFGGSSNMKMNYSDAEWDAYVAANSPLDYTK